MQRPHGGVLAGDGQDSFIKIDGVIVAQSPNIPYRYDRPLQLAVVEDVRRGVIYPADHASDALYWDVDDLLLNVGNDVTFPPTPRTLTPFSSPLTQSSPST